MPEMHDKVLNWASDIEPDTLQQAQRTARMPFVEGHLALMPDAHFGLGATVGSVIPTKGAIIPAAIGVDIGCGVGAINTGLTSHDLPDDLTKLHGYIARNVPSGVGKGHKPHTNTRVIDDHFPGNPMALPLKQANTALNQFGTLGSGNHFVEICLDENDNVWVMLHSGSRGIGNQLAKQHIEGAKKLMKKYFIELEDPDLAYLVEGTPEFEAYIRDMLWAQDYAMGNREAMMDAVLNCLERFLGLDDLQDGVDSINVHHNYTERENHAGKNLWITRKGAIRARSGDRGIIPGSMGTCSYIVSGLGSAASYHSCSHGAGRRMSRGRARKELDVAGLEQMMEGKAWNAAQAKSLIDEDPRAYKDVGRVMADQEDLVQVEHTLTQILNYKGT